MIQFGKLYHTTLMIIDVVIVIIIIIITIVTTNTFTAVVNASCDIIVSCVYTDHDNIEIVPPTMC